MKITSTAAWSARSGIKAMVYGRAGMGKTTLCGTAPKPLIISAEGGLMPLRHKDIPVIEVDGIKAVWEAYNWLTKSNESKGIWTVCIDSASEIAEVVLSSEKKRRPDPRMAYGSLYDETVALLKAFRDMPNRHVLFTAKEESVINPVTGAGRYSPKAPGKQLGPEYPYLFDLLLWAHTLTGPDGKQYHALRTRPDVSVDAKDRSGVLAEIERPDFSYIVNLIMQGV